MRHFDNVKSALNVRFSFEQSILTPLSFLFSVKRVWPYGCSSKVQTKWRNRVIGQGYRPEFLILWPVFYLQLRVANFPPPQHHRSVRGYRVS